METSGRSAWQGAAARCQCWVTGACKGLEVRTPWTGKEGRSSQVAGHPAVTSKGSWRDGLILPMSHFMLPSQARVPWRHAAAQHTPDPSAVLQHATKHKVTTSAGTSE